MKKWLSNIAAILWFIGVLMWFLLLMPIIILMLPRDISVIIESGVGIQTTGFILLMIIGLVVGITMLVPAFRNCFRKLPWLYPYVTILTADIAIIAIAEELLNYGYSVQSESRHTIFLILMIIQIVVCRIGMCIHCYKKPMVIARDEYER